MYTNTMDTIDNKEEREKNLEMIREYHQGLLDNLGVDKDRLKPKCVYTFKSGNVIGVYDSEFKLAMNGGMYFEITDKNNYPQDINRTVYKCPVNPEYQTEYEPSPWRKGSWLVPLEELRIVNPTSVAISGASALVDIVNIQKDKAAKPIIKKEEPTDTPFNEITLRDLYAVLHNKPVSKKEWLNNLINTK